MTTSGKPHLLYLCHRIPYPPNKGDKIRSWHLLQYLAERYQVHLGTFVDDANDWQYADVLDALCTDSCLVDLNPVYARLRSLLALLGNRPLTVDYYRSRQLAHWVQVFCKQHPGSPVVVFSSAMAQFVMHEGSCFSPRVIDFVDIDSDKWQQYSTNQKPPMRWVYRREAKRLFAVEKSICGDFDQSLFVSNKEAEAFREMAPGLSDRIGYFNNGVDSGYFSVADERPDPFAGRPTLVFTGAMDYWPNIDAVTWFVKEVLPLVEASHPELCFCIVGSNPDAAVTRLASHRNVQVTGRVEDVRPYLQHAFAAVAPMRIARGIQNKVLEAMAMQLPVLVSAMGIEGIEAVPGKDYLHMTTETDYVAAISALLDGQHDRMRHSARRFVKEEFSWQRNLSRLDSVLQQGS